jgi:PDZ domain-containing protein
MRRLPLAALVLLTACSAVKPPPVKPPDDQLARLPPYDRSALLVGEEYARAAYVAGTFWNPTDHSHSHLPSSIYAIAIAFGEVNGEVRYTYVGTKESYLGFDGDAWRGLLAARARSPYHQPVRAELGDRTFWCVPERIPDLKPDKPGHALTLEVYDRDPQAPSSRIRAVFDVGLEQHGSLGIATVPVIASDIRGRGLPEGTTGTIVRAVSPGGPAARAGLQPGDVTVAVGGRAVASPDELSAILSSLAPGTDLAVSRLRGRRPWRDPRHDRPPGVHQGEGALPSR